MGIYEQDKDLKVAYIQLPDPRYILKEKRKKEKKQSQSPDSSSIFRSSHSPFLANNYVISSRLYLFMEYHRLSLVLDTSDKAGYKLTLSRFTLREQSKLC